MQCHLNYTGSLTPLFQWSIHKASVDRIIASESRNISASRIKQFTSSVTIQVNASDNGAIFNCKVNFAQLNIQNTTYAPKGPDYEYQWKFALQVECMNCYMLIFIRSYSCFHYLLMIVAPYIVFHGDN